MIVDFYMFDDVELLVFRRCLTARLGRWLSDRRVELAIGATQAVGALRFFGIWGPEAGAA